MSAKWLVRWTNLVLWHSDVELDYLVQKVLLLMAFPLKHGTKDMNACQVK